MKIFYNAGIWVYSKAVCLAARKNPKAAQLIQGHQQVFDYIRSKRNETDRYLWFHAASLGEFEQGRPLIEAIRREHPEYKIALTFFSPSGYEIRKNYAGADLICYLPFDLPANVERFLDLIRPEKVFFIKYEFWANYLTELKKRHIPIYLVSAIFRKEQVFFKWYGGSFRRLLKTFQKIYIQDTTSESLLRQIGINSIEVVGDTRFDRVCQVQQDSKELPLIKRFVEDSNFVMVAGSTWPKDEEIILSHFNKTPNMKLIIAPHEVHESHIQDILAKINRPAIRYSQLSEENCQQADCLIIDTIGLLSSIYKFGQVSYIGGGFGVGIHNVLEAAVYGIPVIFGPNYLRFKEACDLVRLKGAFSMNDLNGYNHLLDEFTQTPELLKTAGHSAGYYVRSHAGASETILKEVFNS